MGIENMFLSILCGIVLSKFTTHRYISLVSAIIVGSLIGFLGALGTFGVVYPFYISVTLDVVHIPEIVPLSVYFLIPQIELYSFSTAWLSSAIPLMPIVAIIFVMSSILSVLLGQIVGHRWIWKVQVTV